MVTGWGRTPVLAAFALVAPLTSLKAQTTPSETTIAVLSVHAGPYDRTDTPVSVSTGGLVVPWTGDPVLVEISGGGQREVPVQVERGTPGRILFVLDGVTPAGSVRSFELRTGRPAFLPGAGARDDGADLVLATGGGPILSYHHAEQPVPEGVDPVFRRSGFIHPLHSPGGAVLTRIQPSDHWHHYGLWNPWTRTRFEGESVDFWNLGGGQGRVRSAGITQRRGGPVAAGFRARLEHVVTPEAASERVVLHETWDVTGWRVEGERPLHVVDFVSTLSAATDSALTIEAYRYQGFSMRARADWDDESTSLITSEGHDKSTGNATRARWIDVGGVSETREGRSGLVMMGSPANFNHPEQLRIWPTGMNEGRENVFVNFNPAQDRDLRIEPGRPVTLAYRIVTYDGTMSPGEADRLWADHAHPPRVSVHPTGLAGRRVLVYTRNGEGFVHDNIAASVAALESMAARHGFVVEVTDRPGAFTRENLARFDALVFSNSNNEAFDTDEQRRALQDYVRGGGGFVGIHSASGSERDWPWFSALLGGNFERHAPRQDFTVEITEPDHPSTAFLPPRWHIVDDECYYLDELNPGIRTLLAADLGTVDDPARDTFPGRLFGDRFPLAWVQEFDGGRQFYTALGHRIEHYADPVFLRHILGGLQWVIHGTAP